MRSLKPILLVEDDNVDAMTVRRTLKELNIVNPLIHKINGQEALSYLEDAENIMPSVIFLDLNMPRMNGLEFLKHVKDNNRLKTIPVIVLTTSKNEDDVSESFDQSVAGYMIKDVDYDMFVEVIKAIDIYWTLSELPDGD